MTEVARPAFSFTNYVAETGTVVTGSTASTSYPAANIQLPQAPMIPWRTTALGSQNIVIAFPSARSIGFLALIRANFAAVTVQGHTSDSWGAPAFSQAVTIGQNPLTGRYQHGVFLAGFNYRYLRLLINTGALGGEAYYLLGGVWAGIRNEPPSRFAWDQMIELIEPTAEVSPEHQGWSQQSIMGDPRMRVTLRRHLAMRNMDQPFVNDDLEKWAILDRSMRLGPFAYHPNQGSNAMAMIATRKPSPQWQHPEFSVADSVLMLEEAMGPS